MHPGLPTEQIHGLLQGFADLLDRTHSYNPHQKLIDVLFQPGTRILPIEVRSRQYGWPFNKLRGIYGLFLPGFDDCAGLGLYTQQFANLALGCFPPATLLGQVPNEHILCFGFDGLSVELFPRLDARPVILDEHLDQAEVEEHGVR